MNLMTTTRSLALLAISVGFAVRGYAQTHPKFQLIPGPFNTWTDAIADAESRGGHLATITSEQEWQQFTNQISVAWTNNEPIWIGASDVEQEGVWKWVTGETWSYTRWGIGEPSGSGVNGKEDYLSVDKNWTWNDSALAIQFPIGYALEYEPEGTLIKAVSPSFTNLSLGANYQLQVSTDLNVWTNSGSSFTATNSTWGSTNYWDVDNWGSLFFRLKTTP